jgi:hypothetical protein
MPRSRSPAATARAWCTSTGSTTSRPRGNAALAASDADWRLVLDGDEWIAEGGEIAAALRPPAPEFVGQICVSSRFDAAGGSVEEAPSWLPRVLPRGVSYQGRINEQPQQRAAATAPFAGRRP